MTDLATVVATLTPQQQQEVGAIAAQVNAPDATQEAIALGVFTDEADATAFGASAQNGMPGGVGFAEALVQFPAKMAFYVAAALAVAMQQDNGLTQSQILADLTGPPGATFVTTGYEIPPAVASQAGPYIQQINYWVGRILSDYNTAANSGDAETNALNAALGLQGLDAIASGAISFGGHQYATSLIVEGPVSLPDGEQYLVYNDPEFGEYVIWNFGPDFIPSLPLDQFVRPGDCTATPGTGGWYRTGAAGGNCPAPPPGYTGGFGLVSARALASLKLTSTDTAPAPGPLSTVPLGPPTPTQPVTNNIPTGQSGSPSGPIMAPGAGMSSSTVIGAIVLVLSLIAAVLSIRSSERTK